jgi:ectoine hydroxylase-related dioxygenase (phytanoyl-CoA dioxygenase family)
MAFARRVVRYFSTAPKAKASPQLKVLTSDQLRAYNRDGCVLLQMLTAAEKANVQKWTSEVEAWPETAGKWMQYFEKVNDKRLLCRTEKYLDYHEPLNALVRQKITDAVSDAMGEKAVLFKEKINFKYPGGEGFKPHQDAPAYVTFNQRFHVTAMVAVDDTTIENGCLEVVRGEHTKGVFPHPGGVMEQSLTDKYQREGKWEPFEAPAGSILIFHSYAPHRSSKNRSSRPRRVHYLTFNPVSDGDFRQAYYADKREKFPPDIERIPGKDYSEGAKIYNVANPIPAKS